MPLTARIGADFSSFERALQTTELKLKGFGGTVSGLQRDLARSVEGFQGTKLFKEAEIAAEGIKRIGGVSKLTEAEQRKVNATVTEALAKYKALGMEAPPHLKELAAATTDTEQKTNLLTGAITRYGRALTFAGIGLAIKSHAEFTGRLSDLAAQTGISATGIQRLQFAAQQSGNSIEQVTDAIGQMSKRIAGSEKSTVDALRSVGLSVDVLRGQKPHEAFENIAGAIAKLPDPMLRSKVAMDIFGRSGVQLLPTLTSNVKALGDEAQRMGLVLSEDVVKQGDKLDDTLQKAGMAGKTLVSAVLGPLTPALTGLAEAASWGAAGLSKLTGYFFDNVLNAKAAVEAWGDVVKVLKDVQPPATKTADIFGQLGIEARDMAADIDAVDEAFGKNNETIRQAIAETEKYQTSVRGLVEQLTGANTAQEVRRLADALATIRSEGKDTPETLTRVAAAAWDLKLKGAQLPPVLQAVVDEFARLQARALPLLASLPAVAGEAAAIRNIMAGLDADGLLPVSRSFAGLMTQAPGVTAHFTTLGFKAEQAAAQTKEWRDQLSGLAQSFTQLAQISGGSFGSLVQDIGSFVGALDLGLKGADSLSVGFDQLTGDSKNIAAGLANLAQGALAVVSGFMQATAAGNTFSKTLSGAAFGAQIGAQLGGGIGAAIGAVAGGIAGLFRGLFAKSEGRKQLEAANADILKLQQSLIGTHGSLEALERQANIVGISFRDAWGHQNVKGLEAFKALVADFEQQQAHLQQALEKYGLTWEDLGDKAKQLKLNEWATSVLDDFNILITAGADFTLVLDKMAPEFSKIIQASMRTGVEVPAAMRPILEQLIELGLLVDENGEKITSFEGISFGETLTQGIDRIVDKLNELLRGLGILPAEAAQSFGAAGREARAFYDEFGGRGGGAGDVDLAHYGGLVTHAGIQRLHQGAARVLPFRRMHTGGLAADEVPAILQVGERVLSRREAAAYEAGARGGDVTIRIPVTLDGERVAEVVARNLPRILSRRGIAS